MPSHNVRPAPARPPPPAGVRASYVEKDRVVRNSTAAPMPGVDCMLGFELSREEFENVSAQAADRAAVPRAPMPPRQPPAGRSGRLGRLRRGGGDGSGGGGSGGGGVPVLGQNVLSHDNVVRQMREGEKGHAVGARPTPAGDYALKGGDTGFRSGGAGHRAVAGFPADRPLETAFDAERYADACRRMAAQLQRATPPDFDGAGELFEKAVDARARFGMYCCTSNADAHVEYAQNLSKRGLTPEAEYHLRAAADIFRLLDARSARKYGDVLLYIAVVIDRQGRLAEAENFYRSALGVYRANKLSDDNVRVAIDSLSNNLRAQGRGEEVDTVIQRHFLGAPER